MAKSDYGKPARVGWTRAVENKYNKLKPKGTKHNGKGYVENKK